MLAIRMQRTGRKGHAMFRVVVQDSRRTPTSGKVVAQLGSYDPHAKTVTLDKEKATFYLEHGAQPSDRATLLLKNEGVKLPDWVKLPAKREGAVRNADKRRSTRPPEEAKPEAAEAPVEEVAEPVVEEAATTDAPAEASAAEAPEAPAEEAKTDEAEVPVAEETETPAPQSEATENTESAEETPAEEAPDTAPAEEAKDA